MFLCWIQTPWIRIYKCLNSDPKQNFPFSILTSPLIPLSKLFIILILGDLREKKAVLKFIYTNYGQEMLNL